MHFLEIKVTRERKVNNCKLYQLLNKLLYSYISYGVQLNASLTVSTNTRQGYVATNDYNQRKLSRVLMEIRESDRFSLCILSAVSTRNAAVFYWKSANMIGSSTIIRARSLIGNYLISLTFRALNNLFSRKSSTRKSLM